MICSPGHENGSDNEDEESSHRDKINHLKGDVNL